ncbi:hypothetical protein OH540_06675 [Streptomyces sp. BPPL-273]|uniref:hypothetical protein n=1 Tax=Streptomyces sp. BPPL-273 TaxID=2987533 RepID=UPI0024AECB72|nr:hypothetical protein [Streptomyces sp. BPPL-273]WHM29718.1 hypothetical protein OH540_06675 [Streptomyces sp. BPPL-273]
MAAEQLPGGVGDITRYLTGLLARLDQGAGWCGVFWRRDPDGMRACLDGREIPPWDVVEALLQDFGERYGALAAGAEAGPARALYAAALTAYDALPGAREALVDRLDVMLREQRYAGERAARLTRTLTHPDTTPETGGALRLDLAWARDDHTRATARCAELRARLAALDAARRGSGGHPADAGPTVPATGAAPGVPADDPSGHARRPEDSVWGFDGSAARGGLSGAAVAAPGAGAAGPVPAPVDGGMPAVEAGGCPSHEATPPADHPPADRPARSPVVAPWSAGSAAEQRTGGHPLADRSAPLPAGRPPWSIDPAEHWAPLPAATSPSADPRGHSAPPPPGAAPTPTPKQRRRRRGGARFAGAVDVDVDVGVSGVPSGPVPVPEGPGPRGARFAGGVGSGDEEAVPVPGEDDRGAVDALVEELARLRAAGLSGAAHALLAEAALGPAPRFPLLAARLERAGLGADWTTLLWETAALPADALAAVADALARAGRQADAEQVLRQDVVRPAAQTGAAVLGLAAEGRHREARALLDACVRARTPQDAARGAAADPEALVPLLLEAARGVSARCHRDLVHALRVAGFTP